MHQGGQRLVVEEGNLQCWTNSTLKRGIFQYVCGVPEPWDKANGAKIKTNLSLRTMDIDKLLLIWLTIHQIN